MGKNKQKTFSEILSVVTKAKNNRFRTNVDEREITLDDAESLLKYLGMKYQMDKSLKIGTMILLIMQKQL